jgi:hypothetical protein
VLRSLPGVPLGNADLIAMNGFVDAGDAGIRVSGNLNIAAVAVLNANNIQVGGASTGVPIVQAPNIGALTAANNTAGAGAKADTPTSSVTQDRPSIIIVEFLGFGGGDGDAPVPADQDRRRGDGALHSYNTNNVLQLVGNGALTDAQKSALTAEERGNLEAP